MADKAVEHQWAMMQEAASPGNGYRAPCRKVTESLYSC